MSKTLKIVSLNSLTKRVKVGFVGTCEKYYCSKEDGFPIIRTTDLIDNGIDFSNLKYITKGFYNKEKKSQLNEGDLLIARHGDNGKAKIYKKKFPAQALNVVIIEPNQDKMSSYLLKCFFETSFVRNQILNSSSGSVQNVVNTKIINDLLIPISSDIEYKRMSKILENLEYKIELNNQINQKLELMAKTLYDYWFVQFDFPDIDGKPYKSSGGKMVYSEELKRGIPLGWEIKTIKDIATIIMGQSPKSISYNNEKKGMPLINGASDYLNGSLMARTYTTAPTRTCKKDDLVFCIRATIGKLTYAEENFCIGRCVASVRVNDKKMDEILFYTLLQEIERFKIHAIGSIIRGITKDDLRDSYIVLPQYDYIEKFHAISFPTFSKLRANKRENQKLTQLRDWLLPMLMNGQVGLNEKNKG